MKFIQFLSSPPPPFPFSSPPLPLLSLPSPDSSWVKKFGEHNGLDVLLNILRSCSSGTYQGKDAILRRIQHQSVRCLKAFMNNKVHWSAFLPPTDAPSRGFGVPFLFILSSQPSLLIISPLLFPSSPSPPLLSPLLLLSLPPLQYGLTKMLQSEQGLIIFVSAMDPFNESMMGDVLRVAAAVCLVADG